MSADRDIERLLDAWLADGPMRISDRVFDEAVGRVHRQRQRPAWRFLWKEPRMSAPIKAVLGAAAIFVVVIAGFMVLGRPTAQVGGIAAPSPAATTTPTASSSPSASASRAPDCANEGVNCPSPLPVGPQTTKVFQPTLTYTAPAGYIEFADLPQFYGVRTAEGATPGGFSVFRDPAISTNANDCAGIPDPAIDGTASGIMAALANDPRFTVTAAKDAKVGVYAAKTFDIALSPAWSGTCPWSDGKPAAALLTVRAGPDATSPFEGVAQGDPASRVYLFKAGSALIWLSVAQPNAGPEASVIKTIAFAK